MNRLAAGDGNRDAGNEREHGADAAEHDENGAIERAAGGLIAPHADGAGVGCGRREGEEQTGERAGRHEGARRADFFFWGARSLLARGSRLEALRYGKPEACATPRAASRLGEVRKKSAMCLRPELRKPLLKKVLTPRPYRPLALRHPLVHFHMIEADHPPQDRLPSFALPA